MSITPMSSTFGTRGLLAALGRGNSGWLGARPLHGVAGEGADGAIFTVPRMHRDQRQLDFGPTFVS